MKKLLRQQAKMLRGEFHQLSGEAASAQIEGNLLSLPEFARAKCVLLYCSNWSEVMTEGLLRKTIEQKGFCVLPYEDNGELGIAKISDISRLVFGKFGLKEPPRGDIVSPKEVDLAVIPGVAFDHEGNRLGYGHGYYDRLLRKLSCPAVGLAYEVQILDFIPSESLDAPVAKIVTENRVIECYPRQDPNPGVG